jgi:hypothetical protein
MLPFSQTQVEQCLLSTIIPHWFVGSTLSLNWKFIWLVSFRKAWGTGGGQKNQNRQKQTNKQTETTSSLYFPAGAFSSCPHTCGTWMRMHLSSCSGLCLLSRFICGESCIQELPVSANPHPKAWWNLKTFFAPGNAGLFPETYFLTCDQVFNSTHS